MKVISQQTESAEQEVKETMKDLKNCKKTVESGRQFMN